LNHRAPYTKYRDINITYSGIPILTIDALGGCVESVEHVEEMGIVLMPYFIDACILHYIKNNLITVPINMMIDQTLTPLIHARQKWGDDMNKKIYLSTFANQFYGTWFSDAPVMGRGHIKRHVYDYPTDKLRDLSNLPQKDRFVGARNIDVCDAVYDDVIAESVREDLANSQKL
jgi:hypothetical protein